MPSGLHVYYKWFNNLGLCTVYNLQKRFNLVVQHSNGTSILQILRNLNNDCQKSAMYLFPREKYIGLLKINCLKRRHHTRSMFYLNESIMMLLLKSEPLSIITAHIVKYQTRNFLQFLSSQRAIE